MGNPRPAPDFFADRRAPGFAEAGTVPTLEGPFGPSPAVERLAMLDRAIPRAISITGADRALTPLR